MDGPMKRVIESKNLIKPTFFLPDSDYRKIEIGSRKYEIDCFPTSESSKFELLMGELGENRRAFAFPTPVGFRDHNNVISMTIESTGTLLYYPVPRCICIYRNIRHGPRASRPKGASLSKGA